MASSNETRALEHIAKAQKLMKKSFFSSADPSGASEYYEKAANLYKLDKAWEKAGETLEKMAECDEAAGNSFSSARQFQAAALCYKNGALPQKSVEALKKAVSRFIEDGKFSQAGNAMKEMSEQEMAAGDAEGAFASISTAIEYLETAGTPAVAHQLKSKAADLAMAGEKWTEAADFLEDISRNVTIASSAVEPLFKATLCILQAGDTVAASKALDRFISQCPEFMRSHEFALVDALVTSLETTDREAFNNAIQTYETKNRKLDPIKRNMVAKIASALPKEDEEGLL